MALDINPHTIIHVVLYTIQNFRISRAHGRRRSRHSEATKNSLLLDGADGPGHYFICTGAMGRDLML